MKRFPQLVVIGTTLLVSGCGSTTFTVLRKATSPNGNRTAFLVRESTKAALASDTYYVTLSDEQNPPLKKIKRKYWGWDKPPLYVTGGEELQLTWQSQSNLLIKCEKCGIRPIDIMLRSSAFDGITISYEGFPATDANTCKADAVCLARSET